MAEVIYRGEADVGAQNSDITLTNVDFPDETIEGQPFEATFKLKNRSSCDASVNIEWSEEGTFGGGSNEVIEVSSGNTEEITVKIGEEDPDIVAGFQSTDVWVGIRSIDSGISGYENVFTVNKLTIDDLVNATNFRTEGQKVSDNTVTGKIDVSNSLNKTVTVVVNNITTDTNQLAKTDIRSPINSDTREETVEFDLELAQVLNEYDQKVIIQVLANDNEIQRIEDTINVKGLKDLISLQSINIPDQLNSGNEVSSFDADVTINSEISDINLEAQLTIDNTDSVVGGSTELITSGEKEIGISFTAPTVEDEEVFDVDVSIVNDGIVVASGADTITVKGPLAFTEVNGIEGPQAVNSGESAEFSVLVENTSDEIGNNIEMAAVFEGSEVTSTSVRSGSTDTLDFTVGFPEVTSETQETIEATVLVGDSEAGVVSKNVVIEPLSANIGAGGLSLPKEGLSGESVSGSVNLENTGSSSANASVVDGNGNTLKEATIEANNNREINFELELPGVTQKVDREFVLNVVSNDVQVEQFRPVLTINTRAQQVEFASSKSPNVVLSGNQGTIEAVVRNNNNDEITADIEYDGSVVKSGNVAPNSEDTITFTFQTPNTTETTEVTIDYIIKVGQTTVDSVSETVTVKHPSNMVEIESVSSASEVIGGNSVEVTVAALNNYNSAIQSSVHYDDIERDSEEIRAESASDLSFIVSTDEVDSKQTKTVEVVLKADGVVADTEQQLITVTPRNDSSTGDDDTEDSPEDDTGDSGGSGDTQVVNHINIDTKRGSITVEAFGYAEGVSINGILRGRSVSIGEGMSTRRPANILPGRLVEFFEGELNSANQTIVTFDSVSYVELEADKLFTWSLNGNKKQKSKTITLRIDELRDI